MSISRCLNRGYAQIKNDLPPDVQIQVEKMNPSILPVIGFTVESDKKTPIELNLIATYIIKPFLSQIDGVSSVGIIGGKTKEYWIELNQLKMSTFSITPEIIRDMLRTRIIFCFKRISVRLPAIIP